MDPCREIHSLHFTHPSAIVVVMVLMIIYKKMGFLRRVAGVSLREKERRSIIHEKFEVKALLLCVEKSQLRWFGHLVRTRAATNDYFSID